MAVNLRALIGKLNDTTRNALEAAAGLCLSRTHYDVEVEHYLMKLLDSSSGDLAAILKHFEVDKSRLAAELTRSLDKLKSGNARNPALSPTLLQDAQRGLDAGFRRLRRGAGTLRLHHPGAGCRRGLVAHDAGSQPGIPEDQCRRLRKDFQQIVANSEEEAAAAATAAAEARWRRSRALAARRPTSISSPSISPETRAPARSIRCWRAISRFARWWTS